MTDEDRGQAFTLEGFVAAAIVLTSVLFAIQTVVAPPESGGTDRTASLRVQAEDILRSTASAERDLSHAVRYWDPLRQRYYKATDRDVGYGNESLPDAMFNDSFRRTFSVRGFSYNIVVVYHLNNSSRLGQEPIVYQGEPAADAVTARHAVTLYDNQRLTSPVASRRPLSRYDTNATDNDADFYPYPDINPGPVYNVMEVRVTIW